MPDRQVSHFVVEAVVALADHAQLSVSELCEGLSVDEHDLRRRMGGLAWDELVMLVERMEAKTGRDRLIELGTRVTQLAPIAQTVLRRLIKPRHMLHFVFRTLGPSMYPMYTLAYDEQEQPDGSVVVHVSLRLKEGFRDCPTLFALHGVSTAAIPVILGDAPLPVRSETTGRGGDYWFTVR
jgi:hypothetical protein